MKPGPVHHRLIRFIKTIKDHAPAISIEKMDTRLLERFMEDECYQERFGEIMGDSLRKVTLSKNIEINDDQQLAFSMFSSQLRWKIVDGVNGTGPIYGGFAFHQGESMVMWPSNKWKKGYQDFLEYAEENTVDKELLHKLTWFESPTPVIGPNYTPYYGCVLTDGESFPHEFYFFDGGIIYPLPFRTYEAYITSLIENVGLECWQYFFVEPALLIQRNKGLNYMTTDLRIRTRLEDKVNPFVYNPSTTFDRLDLIVEHLKRSLRILPAAFPAFNFDYQVAYLKKLEKLLW